MITVISNGEKLRRIKELQQRQAQINRYLLEDAEDMISHGWAMPDHREYFAELEEIKTELSLLGVE